VREVTLLLAVVTVLAGVAVGGWIGYRATSKPTCFEDKGYIECLQHGRNLAYPGHEVKP
jgi:hypothetical protein